MDAIIVDDELLARERIVHLLKERKEIQVVRQCSSGKSALSAVKDLNPDIVFLDIDMKDMNGIQVLENLDVSPKPIVIFVTAYDRYALKAFDFEAFDFLLKPFTATRFFKTIDKIIERSLLEKSKREIEFDTKLKYLLKQYNPQFGEDSLHKLPIKKGNRTTLINVPDINYIIASGYYAEIFIGEKKHLIRESLSNLISSLDGRTFIRIHRSAIINLEYVKEIIHSDYSEVDVRMKDNKLIRISKSRKKEFLQKVGI